MTIFHSYVKYTSTMEHMGNPGNGNIIGIGESIMSSRGIQQKNRGFDGQVICKWRNVPLPCLLTGK